MNSNNLLVKTYNLFSEIYFSLFRIGGWSTEGVTVDKMNSNRTSVTCFTTHLTSFAVLVSTADEQVKAMLMQLRSYMCMYVRNKCETSTNKVR